MAHANKRMYVLLVDGGPEARKQEIIALVGNADWVGFESCKYSYTRLKAVMDEISADREADRDGNVPACWIDERENCVNISVLKETVETVGQRYKDCYGDMVRVEEGQPIPKTDGKGRVLGIPKTGDAADFGYLPPYCWAACACAFLGKGPQAIYSTHETQRISPALWIGAGLSLVRLVLIRLPAASRCPCPAGWRSA